MFKINIEKYTKIEKKKAQKYEFSLPGSVPVSLSLLLRNPWCKNASPNTTLHWRTDPLSAWQAYQLQQKHYPSLLLRRALAPSPPHLVAGGCLNAPFERLLRYPKRRAHAEARSRVAQRLH